jgi:hypothetical protein
LADALDGKLRRSTTVAHRTVDGQTVIILPRKGQVMVLNETGRQVWDLSDGTLSVEEIAQRMAEEYGVDAVRARADVESLYRELLDEGVVEATS